MGTFLATTDLSDAHPEVQVLAPMLRHFGGKKSFHGEIATLAVLEDNALVRRALESEGGGRVLVVDGQGSLRCALLGGNLAALAASNGWAGVIVHGCVRDTLEIAACSIGVMAIASHPRRPDKSGAGSGAHAIAFGGVTFAPGHWLYADDDGVIVSAVPIHGA